MDDFLASLYGTNEPDPQDFEKVAHLDFLEKVAEEEGIDLNELSDEDLEELAGLAAEALDEGSVEYEDEDDEFEKEAEAKVEEADFLGRVMAHSFNQEMDLIEKSAGARIESAKAAIGRGWGKARGAAREAYGRTARAGRQTGRAVQRSPLGRFAEPSTLGGRMRAGARRVGRSVDAAARRLGRRLGAETQLQGRRRGAAAGWRAGKSAPRPGGRARRALDVMTFGRSRRGLDAAIRGETAGARQARRSQRLRGYGAAAGAAGLAGAGAGGAYLATREKKSADEQWEEAVQARAWEHLMAAGLADESGNFIPAEDLQKTATEADIDYEVDADALELLEAEGYPVEWY